MPVASSMPLVDNPGPRAMVIRTVTDWLDSGRLRPGEPLPSARSLARQLRLDPRTVGVALDMLQENGLIRQRANGRRIVNSDPHAASPRKSFLSNAVVMITGGDLLNPSPVLIQPGWSMQLEMAARAAIQRNGHHFVVFNIAQLQEQLKRLLQDRPLGVIVADPEHVKGDLMPLLVEARRNGLNVVVYGDAGHFEALDQVVSNHVAGCRRLTGWTIEQGRRCPALLVPMSETHRPWVQERIRGYREACFEVGIDPLPPIELPRLDEGWANADLFSHKSRVIAGYLADILTGPNQPDALLAPSDGPAYAVAAACRLLHCSVHDRVMVVGYDNYWEGSPERNLKPFSPAATVDKRNDLIGTALVDLLAQRVAGELPHEPQCRVIEPELIVYPVAQRVSA